MEGQVLSVDDQGLVTLISRHLRRDPGVNRRRLHIRMTIGAYRLLSDVQGDVTGLGVILNRHVRQGDIRAGHV